MIFGFYIPLVKLAVPSIFAASLSADGYDYPIIKDSLKVRFLLMKGTS